MRVEAVSETIGRWNLYRVEMPLHRQTWLGWQFASHRKTPRQPILRQLIYTQTTWLGVFAFEIVNDFIAISEKPVINTTIKKNWHTSLTRAFLYFLPFSVGFWHQCFLEIEAQFVEFATDFLRIRTVFTVVSFDRRHRRSILEGLH